MIAASGPISKLCVCVCVNICCKHPCRSDQHSFVVYYSFFIFIWRPLHQKVFQEIYELAAPSIDSYTKHSFHLPRMIHFWPEVVTWDYRGGKLKKEESKDVWWKREFIYGARLLVWWNMLRIRANFVWQRDLLEGNRGNFIASTSSKMIRTIQPANEILSPASELLPIATNIKPLRVAREPLDFTHSECMMIQKLSCYILHLLSSSSTLTDHLNTFVVRRGQNSGLSIGAQPIQNNTSS
jgi:hypothetical protein